MKSNKKLFMSCSWTNLLYVNFRIDAEIINALLPKDLEADLFDGFALLSFVGFRFTDAKLFGVKIPFHQYFPEINLRTYVKSKKNPNEKGIFFISEMVPKFMTYFVGKYIYGEPFSRIGVKENSDEMSIGYEISKKSEEVKMSADLVPNSLELSKNKEEEFIIDRVFAFCGKADEKSKKYEVQHPKWNLLKVEKSVYSFVHLNNISESLNKFLKEAVPCSIFATDGSAVDVFRVFD
jgi:hypothetical protein